MTFYTKSFDHKAPVLTGAKVHKILFANTNTGLRATGVEVSFEDQVQTYTAVNEVILAAGTFNTPKLLELSGIGSKKVLEQYGIPISLDLPGVGENLQDHLMTGVSYEVVEGVITGDPLMRQEPEALALAQKLYVEHQAGPLTIGGVQSHAFMPTPGSDQSELLNNYPPDSKNAEYYNVIRSILDSADECSAAWSMFLAQANLHKGAKSFVGVSCCLRTLRV